MAHRDEERRAGWVALAVLAAATLGLWLLWPVGGTRSGPPVQAEPGWQPAGQAHGWTCIVIHHSATDVGGALRFDQSHRDRGWDELGYHFVIGNGTDTGDGQIEVGSRWLAQKRGAHCKTPDGYYNEHGIGICLVGNLDNTPPTAKQQESLRRLTAYLCHEFGISRDQILTHGLVTGQTRCPGQFLDLDSIRRAAAPERTSRRATGAR